MKGELTGRVRPVLEDGRAVRGKYQLVVNLPSLPVLDDLGKAVLDEQGEPRRRYPETTKLVSASGVKDSQRQLQAWVAELEAHNCVDPERLTVAGLAALYLAAAKEELRAVSCDTYARNLRLHILPALGEMLARDLRRHHLSRYYTDKRATLAETTVYHHATAISAMFTWGEGEGYVGQNPARRVKKSSKPRLVVRPRRRVWEMSEIVETVIAARKTQLHLAVLLAGLAGLRAGEICALRRADLELDRGYCRVIHTVEETGSSAGSDRRLVEYPPKGGPGVVPLPRFACDELRKAFAAQDEMRLARPGWNREGWVLPKVDGAQMWPSTLKGQWARWLAGHRRRLRKRLEEDLGRELHDVELLPRLSLHGLRDSYGSDVFKHEGLKAAQERLRHKDPVVTLRHYVEVSDLDELAGLARMEQDVMAAVSAAEASSPGDSRIIPENVVRLAGRSAKK
jgi:integrase